MDMANNMEKPNGGGVAFVALLVLVIACMLAATYAAVKVKGMAVGSVETGSADSQLAAIQRQEQTALNQIDVESKRLDAETARLEKFKADRSAQQAKLQKRREEAQARAAAEQARANAQRQQLPAPARQLRSNVQAPPRVPASSINNYLQ